VRAGRVQRKKYPLPDLCPPRRLGSQSGPWGLISLSTSLLRCSQTPAPFCVQAEPSRASPEFKAALVKYAEMHAECTAGVKDWTRFYMSDHSRHRCASAPSPQATTGFGCHCPPGMRSGLEAKGRQTFLLVLAAGLPAFLHSWNVAVPASRLLGLVRPSNPAGGDRWWREWVHGR